MKKEIYIKKISTCIILGIFVITLSYFIFKTNILEPKLNELTTSYISFNNINNTDILKLNNINKMSDTKAKSILNNSTIKLNITGNKNEEYYIVVYKDSDIDDKYINCYINKKVNLSEVETTSDGGKIIYTGKIDNKTKILKMWIDKSYKDKVKDNSFEIKIKKK